MRGEERNVPDHGEERSWGERLIEWFEGNQRDLPWRKNPSGYAVWISEIMLQQTQVERVIPYYLRWMNRFPDVISAADASLDELLHHWEGLGYYTRLHNISKTARLIVRQFNGLFPVDFETLLSLPGIGRYTAGAISSISANQSRPAVDGNVLRVMTRLFDYSQPVTQAASRRWIEERVLEGMPGGRAGSFNQSLMELGACVCLPRNPRCPDCAVVSVCLGSARGTWAARPVRTGSSRRIEKNMVSGVVWDKGAVFLRRRPHQGLMAGLWEFPACELDQVDEVETFQQYLQSRHQLNIQVQEILTDEIFSYTVHRVKMRVFSCILKSPDPIGVRGSREGWFKPAHLSTVAFPAVHRRIAMKFLL